MSLSLKLMKKVEVVRAYYGSDSDDNAAARESKDIDVKLYASMQRWHLNGHITEKDWIDAFEKIKFRLKTKNSFLPECMPLGLSEFLKRKFKTTVTKEQFSESEIFPERLVLKIFRYYEDLNDEETAAIDEFDVENVVSGIPSDQINYVKQTFLPLAYFYTYQEKHSDTPAKELMEDCFDVGAGSKGEDLFPEVNSYCEACSDGFGSWESRFQHLNFILHRKQVKNKFDLPNDMTDLYHELEFEKLDKVSVNGGASDEDMSVNSGKLDEDLSVNGGKWDEDMPVNGPGQKFAGKIDDHEIYEKFENPFLSSSSSQSDSVKSLDEVQNDGVIEDEKSEASEIINAVVVDNEQSDVIESECTGLLKNAKCSECNKVFSKELFLVMHIDLFHGAKQKIRPKFIDNDNVDLMTSFINDEISSSSPAPGFSAGLSLGTDTGCGKDNPKICAKGQGKRRKDVLKKRTALEMVDKQAVRKSLRFEKS